MLQHEIQAQPDILVVRDQSGTPYILPQRVMEEQELIALRVGDDDYLIPRSTLLAHVVPTAHTATVAQMVRDGHHAESAVVEDTAAFPFLRASGADGPTEALAIRSDDGHYFAIPKRTLEGRRATTPSQRAAVELMLGQEDVTGHSEEAGTAGMVEFGIAEEPLTFKINRITKQYAAGSRGFSRDVFVS